MKVWTCTDHAGHWPVGVASVVVANTEDEARATLDLALKNAGLKTSTGAPYTLNLLETGSRKARILRDGDY